MEKGDLVSWVPSSDTEPFIGIVLDRYKGSISYKLDIYWITNNTMSTIFEADVKRI